MPTRKNATKAFQPHKSQPKVAACSARSSRGGQCKKGKGHGGTHVTTSGKSFY